MGSAFTPGATLSTKVGPAVIPCFDTAITVERRVPGSYVDGFYVDDPVPISFSLQAAVQPATPEELQQVEEARRTDEGINIWVTNTQIPAWEPSREYDVGDRRTNAGNVYIVTTAGTSAGAGGPSGTGTGIADGTVVWDFVVSGSGLLVGVDAPDGAQPDRVTYRGEVYEVHDTTDWEELGGFSKSMALKVAQ